MSFSPKGGSGAGFGDASWGCSLGMLPPAPLHVFGAGGRRWQAPSFQENGFDDNCKLLVFVNKQADSFQGLCQVEGEKALRFFYLFTYIF